MKPSSVAATALADGRFMYLDGAGKLFLEDQLPGSDLPAGKFSLLIGHPVISFAVEEDKNLVALLLRSDSDVVLRVYSLEGSDLGGQLVQDGGKKVDDHACAVMWLGNGEFLAVNCISSSRSRNRGPGAGSSSSPLSLYAWREGEGSLEKQNSSELSALARYHGGVCFTTLRYLGVLEAEKQLVHFYDVNERKVVERYAVPDRHATTNNNNEKTGPSRVVSSAMGDKNFVIIASNDGALHGVYVTKGSVRKLSPMITDFCTAATAISSPPPRVLCTAISSGQAFVTLNTGEEDDAAVLAVGRYRYIKKAATLVLAEKVELHTPRATAIAAISPAGRCLVRVRGATEEEKFVVETPVFTNSLPAPTSNGSHTNKHASDITSCPAAAAVPRSQKAEKSAPPSSEPPSVEAKSKSRKQSTREGTNAPAAATTAPTAPAPAPASSSFHAPSFVEGVALGVVIALALSVRLTKRK